MSGGKRSFDWASLRPAKPVAPQAAETPSTPGGAESDAAESEARPSPGAPREEGSAAPFMVRVNDLKQFAYCPRIVFYQYAMPVQRKATFKMERGKEVELRVEQLEKRRKLREYGLAEGRRRFQVWLTATRLGVSGRVDLMIETPHGIFPVDFKDTRARVQHNHHVQLCAYALLIEERIGRPVSHGFIYRVPRNDVTPVEMTEALRAETLRAIDEVRDMVLAERMPPATSVRGRCADCEYRNYCGDVF